MPRSVAAIALLLLGLLAASTAFAQQSTTDAESVLDLEGGENGRHLLASKCKGTGFTYSSKLKKCVCATGYTLSKGKCVKKAKPTKKPTQKVLTGAACRTAFGSACTTCTKSGCRTCTGTGFAVSAFSKKCVCKAGYYLSNTKKACLKKKVPTKKVTAAPTKKPAAPSKTPTKKAPVTPTKKPTTPSKTPTKAAPVTPTKAPSKAPTRPATKTQPEQQADVADPAIKPPKSLTKNCAGATSGSLKFTVLAGLSKFPNAAAACKAAGLRLPTIDDIFAGDSSKPGEAALSTITKCLGTNQAVWFDTSLAAPYCNAFNAVGSPADGGVVTGRKLSALPNVLLTQEVATGCNTQLPVLCA